MTYFVLWIQNLIILSKKKLKSYFDAKNSKNENLKLKNTILTGKCICFKTQTYFKSMFYVKLSEKLLEYNEFRFKELKYSNKVRTVHR